MSMRNEADGLLEDLEYIRSNAGTVAPDHPKVKKWIAEVRGYLTHEKNKKELKRFEHLDFVKGGSEMWSQYSITQGNIRKYKAELDKVETILGKIGEHSRPSGESSADEKMRELFLTPDEETTEEETEVEAIIETAEETVEQAEVETQLEALVEKTFVESADQGERENRGELLSLEKAMDHKIEPNFEAVTEQHLSTPAREKAVDQLMAELGAEMKSLDPDWEKIQRVMGDMMGVKKTGELLERLKAEANNPEVKWEAIRKIMAQLWAIKQEIIIDLLPTLLKS